MFRKEYKQANDNIKVDEALLERTLEAAFAEKPKKKTYYYRSFAPVAAALVIVIGASAAYPKLMEKPEIEHTVTTTVTSTVTPTLNPNTELRFEAVTEATPAPEKKENVSRPKPAKKPTVKNGGVDNADAITVEADAAVVSAADETDDFVSDASAVPSLARTVTDEIEAYNAPEQPIEGFSQIACKFAEGASEYVYENSAGKSFTVTVTDACDEAVSGLSVERNGKLYVFSSQNMTDTEILEAFETLTI